MKPPNLLAGLKACPRKGEERMEWEGRKKGAQWVHYIMSCCANYEPTHFAMQTSICQKRPIFRIPFFRPLKMPPPGKCHRERMPPSPPPSRRHCVWPNFPSNRQAVVEWLFFTSTVLLYTAHVLTVHQLYWLTSHWLCAVSTLSLFL